MFPWSYSGYFGLLLAITFEAMQSWPSLCLVFTTLMCSEKSLNTQA